MNDADKDRLQHMRLHAQRARAIVAQHGAQALHDGDERLSALLWEVSIVGEAASRLSRDAQKLAAHLPLNQARAMRNLLIHNYPEVRAEVVVETVRDDFPALIAQIDRLLGETPE